MPCRRRVTFSSSKFCLFCFLIPISPPRLPETPRSTTKLLQRAGVVLPGQALPKPKPKKKQTVCQCSQLHFFLCVVWLLLLHFESILYTNKAVPLTQTALLLGPTHTCTYKHAPPHRRQWVRSSSARRKNHRRPRRPLCPAVKIRTTRKRRKKGREKRRSRRKRNRGNRTERGGCGKGRKRCRSRRSLAARPQAAATHRLTLGPKSHLGSTRMLFSITRMPLTAPTPKG